MYISIRRCISTHYISRRLSVIAFEQAYIIPITIESVSRASPNFESKTTKITPLPMKNAKNRDANRLQPKKKFRTMNMTTTATNQEMTSINILHEDAGLHS